MATFPLDVVAEILCRLPVDCVLCCRCVSKSWLALIDSPEFFKLHVKYSVNTNFNLWLILNCFGYRNGCFKSLNFDSLNSRVVTPKELTNPLMSYESNTKILILIWKRLPYGTPSTRKYKNLPFLNHLNVNLGLGYDVINDDYKVVRIVQFLGSEKGSVRSDVYVYSLRSSCWRGVDEELVNYYIRHEDQSGTYLNGSLHWIARGMNKLEPLIVAFDLGTEKWRLVPHPPYTGTRFIVKLKLVVLGSSLCAYYRYLDSYEDLGYVEVLDHVDIWVMKEYGVNDSWTMVASLEQPDKQIGRTVVPLAYSKNGEEILVEQNNRRFMLTSINGDYVKIFDTEIGTLHGFEVHFNSYVYVGRLGSTFVTEINLPRIRST
ncbi:F-box protein CPR1-like [Lycium ferocissimum]|uniref:F-box protein CPR1-like n=1 Tax=Lycium ferocissimum TaxID=112874 RepID=UPI002816241A|nr:F-box protein CPR1-like [Lycium ferocissimum]